MINEVFKDIFGYEGLYQISNYGRIKSLGRKSIFYCGLKKEYLERKVKEKILCFHKTKNGYVKVILYKDSKSKTYFIHRLVAETFIDNPLNKETVNHINGNKLDNRVENLEWATIKENNQHAFKTGLNKPHNQRKIKQFTKEGIYIKSWNSIIEYLKFNNLDLKYSGITTCCKGRRKYALGYKWEYEKQ